jgi:glycosyltransferase involved in cell wall biosynthesis
VRVSIVTISLNQARYLPRALASVQTQDFGDIEYIVVDAGSTDGSREIINARAGQLAHVVLDPDEGPADGLNKGFALAAGDVLAYVNADDALLPGSVAEAAEYLRANPNIDVVYGDGFMIDADGRVIRRIESSPFSLRRYSYGGVAVVQQATFIRRTAYDRVRGFNQANTTCWDGEILVDIAISGGRLRHLRRAWGVFTVHPQSISGSGRLSAQYQTDLRRIFLKAHGHPWRPIDSLIARLVRVEKWVLSPGATFRRIREMAKRGPRLRLVLADDNSLHLVPDKRALA